jgi:multiple sugar transport system substrate-binding protein
MSIPRDPKHDDQLRDLIASRLARANAGAYSRRSLLRRGAGLAGGVAAASLFKSFTPKAVNAAQRVLQTTGSSADAAVEAAKQFSGSNINLIWESNLQAQDPLLFSGPKWTELTGINVTVVEKPFEEMYPATVSEHIAGTGAYDVISIVPAWQADFVIQGIAEPLTPFVDQYMNKADLDDYHPLYRDLMNYGGQIYGLFDDGDTIVLYYRRDLFEDQANKDEYKAATGKDLAKPETWEDYDAIRKFFTEKMQPDLYGGASQRVIGGLHGWFMEEYRNRGGTFFNPDTMDALVNGPEAKTTLDRWIESDKFGPPGIETYDFVKILTDWMGGKLAMIGGTWPPIGRWSEAYGKDTPQLSFVPASTVAEKVGYSVMPMGHSAHNGGFSLGVASSSQNKEAAYLFCQWATSPEISLERCMLPYALRDPYRMSHYSSEAYRALWPAAGEYLDTLKGAADGALLDLVMPGSFDYHISIDQAATAALTGSDVQGELDKLATTWNEITDRLGRDAQKSAYAEYIKLKGAYPQMA